MPTLDSAGATFVLRLLAGVGVWGVRGERTELDEDEEDGGRAGLGVCGVEDFFATFVGGPLGESFVGEGALRGIWTLLTEGEGETLMLTLVL